MVGVISAAEMIQLAAHSLGAWERRGDLTLTPLRLGPGVLGKIADVVEAADARLQAIYPLGRHKRQPDEGGPEKPVIFRFDAEAATDIVSAMEAAGIPVSEPIAMPRMRLAV